MRPPELGTLLGQVHFETGSSYTIEVAVCDIESVFPHVDLPDQTDACLLMMISTIILLLCRLKIKNHYVRLIKPSLITKLKSISHTYHPSMVVESDGASDPLKIRQGFSGAVERLSYLWLKENELAHSHKLAMRRSIRLGTYEMKGQD